MIIYRSDVERSRANQCVNASIDIVIVAFISISAAAQISFKMFMWVNICKFKRTKLKILFKPFLSYSENTNITSATQD